jgi:ferric-dicitrate binding protein FerR (iron transport regulator)
VRGVDGRGSRNNARGGLLTAATPRGGTYQITLPDGTKVWLNAASSLKFPASFGSLKTRSVELTGEGYFEVAKDKAHPFIVATAKQEVQVLGTHFNINAYNDEGSTKTTLLEGSVSVSSLPLYSSSRGKRSDERPLGHATSRDLSYRRDDGGGRDDVVLKPNQESVLTNNAQIRVTDVTAEDAVAWKNGDFVFRGEALESVMRKVARWYDVEVVYADDVPRDVVIGGYVSRSRNISVVLERMAKTGRIKFKIEGKKITVMK